MKKQEWNEALDHLDPALVEEYVTKKARLGVRAKRKKLGLRIVAIAACLALLVGSLSLLPLLRGDEAGELPGGETTEQMDPNAPYPHSTEPISPPNTTEGPIERPIIPMEIFQQPSSAPQYYGSQESIIGSSYDACYDTSGVSVVARFLEALPDTYVFFDDWEQTEFRLIRMEVLEVLNGENMPAEFLFIVPTPYMTDYSVYDKFVFFEMVQHGCGYSVLYNTNQACAEQLTMVLFGAWKITWSFGDDVMAFDSEDRIDLELWTSTQTWSKDMRKRLEQFEGYTLQDAKERGLKSHSYQLSVGILSDMTGESAEILSFENGIYVPKKSNSYLYVDSKRVTVTRYIDGYATNEKIQIESDGRISYKSEMSFSEEDLQRLPNLDLAMTVTVERYKAGEIMPPHLPDDIIWAYLRYYGIFGWYAKTQNGVIGIVRVTWAYDYSDFNQYYYDDRYYDDAYFIIEYGSDEVKPIDRDSLLTLFSEKRVDYVYDGEYNEYGKVRENEFCC